MNNHELENILKTQGYKLICGVDEVGRGCLAGKVFACAIIMKDGSNIDGVTDSKKICDKKRRELYPKILEESICYNVSSIDVSVIDEINILEASRLAMVEAIKGLSVKPDFIMTDYMEIDTDIPYNSLIKGDLYSYTISCASIVAKVERDNYMIELSKEYPEYEWDKNKGYGTKKHLESLKKYGITKYHRLSYKPIKKIIEQEKI